MTDKSLKYIAKALKDTRTGQHLTQNELAKRAGISMNYYSRIERVEVSPSVETLGKIIKALGVKSSDILPF
jgi:transcriptional regulator with XRE-family HTH domain